VISIDWDPPTIHGRLARLMWLRWQFRFGRTISRIGSAKRILATALAGLFLVAYVLAGVFILATRAPADPERLRLWLSGGMVIYLMYHLVRCVWTEKVPDLELTAAESLWLGGAPIQRSSVAIYHANKVVMESILKSLLLTVILARDVFHVELLIVGLVASLVLLQIGRLVLQRLISGLDPKQIAWARFIATVAAGLVVLQVLARLAASTPLGSPIPFYVTETFSALGQTAASDMIQWLSLPWWPASRLIVSQHYDLATIGSLVATMAAIPLAIATLVRVDAWVLASQLRNEQVCLSNQKYRSSVEQRESSNAIRSRFAESSLIERFLPESIHDVTALVHRQVITARRYRSTILFSFLIPTLLCLSPLATGQIHQQWLFVVGGIALCTMLLAPPALQIDFRRDLKRMMLLRSLPVRPRAMVLGQLAIPVMVTLAFQWITILIAAWVARPGWSQTLLWTGMLSALAVFTFAAENALFLTFPHHQHRQGIAMMIRAKLVFLGKVAVIIGSLTMLLVWITFCRRYLSVSIAGPALIVGPVLATWTIAIALISVTTRCWQRFDLERDIPPQ
jgi:hypothetical protein